MMDESDPHSLEAAIAQIRYFAKIENVRLTLHAHQEMVEEDISMNEVLESLTDGQILENYPEHQRGSCCLVYGATHKGRPLHSVCTTSKPVSIIITVYEPKLPKWLTPTQRSR